MAGRKEIEEQIATLQKQLDTAGSDDEVWIKEGEREFKVTGERAGKILGRFADLFADGEGEGQGEAEGQGEGQGEEPAKTYFRKK